MTISCKHRREEKKAVLAERNVMPVAIVAPTYMNPRQKKDEAAKRRKRQKEAFEKRLREGQREELPEESTVSYYV